MIFRLMQVIDFIYILALNIKYNGNNRTTENVRHENVTPSKMQVVKMWDMKMQVKVKNCD